MKHPKRYTETETFNLLMKAIDKAGSQKAFATANQLSQSQINDICNMRRDISDGVASKLGLRKIVMFEETKPV